ncbi:MAG: hypothetical protein K9J30_13870 [Bacteroidales bacterium]|nr:hypothetical protein [Bacteroidales bacterium]
MKFLKHKIKPYNSRRYFLKSAGTFLAGLSIFRPLLASSGTNSVGYKRKDKANGPSVVPLEADELLPDGVRAVWDLSKAYREKTVSRERICINGLWQWQPGRGESEPVPASNWGYFKVPGSWPGITHYLQKESQTLFAHPAWKIESLRNTDVAWYQREISIPENWRNRQIVLSSEYLNSSAEIFIDGKRTGEILFPAGELDLTPICIAGNTHLLSMKVTALPLSDVVAIFSDSNASRQGRGQVARRGLCGDVFLISRPLNASVRDVQIITSVRKKKITFKVRLDNLKRGEQYKLRYSISDGEKKVREFTSSVFNTDDLKDNFLTYTASWLPEKLWDIHTPKNMYDCTVSLFKNDNTSLDTAYTIRFGFREFRIEGRDFFLNGSRIYLSAVPIDNALVGAALANYEAAKESMHRLMSFGINFVYTHNYGCEPGTHIGYDEILRAADDTGMLISFSQPHFGQYDWQAEDADRKNGYAHHAEFYTKVAGNHPSVVFYSMSHNACGYTDDMNPDRIDGLTRTASEWSNNNARKAVRAEAIVAALDSGRIIYHHSSGNLGSMHTSNFYPNWVPVQEMSDWFEHWATKGEKPLFTCEYAAPFTWDWGLYRGWYKGKREFGSAAVPWEFCMAEWNSQFLGDEAFRISELEKRNLRWESERFKEGAVWYRWDYPHSFGDKMFNERIPVLIKHLAGQWRAFRTWGISANSPWDYSSYWQLQEESTGKRKNLIVDWDNLQKPGFSADFTERNNRMDLDVAFDQSDWIPTAATALMENNMPLLAYIGGNSSSFTSKDHNFLPGTKFNKQLIIINNTRTEVACECKWSLNLPDPINGEKTISLQTGSQEQIPLEFELPGSLPPGKYKIDASFRFSNRETQNDSFEINVILSPEVVKQADKLALYDPKGQTRQLLDDLGINYQEIEAGTSLEGYDTIIIGKEAMTTGGAGLDIDRVREGLKVIVFEQSTEVLEKRFGFRVVEYGLRNVFTRIPDHPALTGLDQENLRDWRGDATLYPDKLEYTTDPDLFNGVPTIRWCDIPVTKIWRCGNRGNVASVLIEKPACGDFLPIIDGGYSLQYSPLMEYKEGKGMVLFCQMDVTGRTETEPAAKRLVRNIYSYVSDWKPNPTRHAVYAGEENGLSHLQKTGVAVSPFAEKKLSDGQILVAGPGSGKILNSHSKKIKKWIQSGGQMLAIGFDQEDANALLPFEVVMKKEEHIASYFEPSKPGSPFAGIGPSDVHNREPKEYPLVAGGTETVGNGVLATTENGNPAFCQLTPWKNDYSNEKHNVKQTYRRSSFLLNRLLCNMGAVSSTPLLARFSNTVDPNGNDKRWLDGFYMDEPEEWDYPYRFFRW